MTSRRQRDGAAGRSGSIIVIMPSGEYGQIRAPPDRPGVGPGSEGASGTRRGALGRGAGWAGRGVGAGAAGCGATASEASNCGASSSTSWAGTGPRSWTWLISVLAGGGSGVSPPGRKGGSGPAGRDPAAITCTPARPWPGQAGAGTRPTCSVVDLGHAGVDHGGLHALAQGCRSHRGSAGVRRCSARAAPRSG